MTDVEYIDFPGLRSAVVRRTGLPTSEIREFMDTAFSALGRAIAAGDVQPVGPAFSRYDSPYGEVVDVEVGFPIDQSLAATIETEGVDIVASELPACRLAVTKYVGEYEGLGEAWGEFIGAVKGAGHDPGMPYWEAYDEMPEEGKVPTTGLAVPVTG